MAQSPLDRIPDLDAIPDAPARRSSLDDIPGLDAVPDAPKKKRGMWDRVFTPIPALQDFAHEAATKIRGFKEAPPERVTEAPSLTDIVGGIASSALTGIPQFLKEVPATAKSFYEQPVASAKGLAAGLLESFVGEATPADIAMTALGARTGIRSGASVAKGAAEAGKRAMRRITDPQGAAFEQARHRGIAAVAEKLQEAMSGTRELPSSRLRNPSGKVVASKPGKMTPGEPTEASTQASLLREVAEELRKESAVKASREGIGLPSDIDAPMPGIRSRQVAGDTPAAKGPAIPDPGGMMGFAQDAGRAAVGAEARARSASRSMAQAEDMARNAAESRKAMAEAIDAAVAAKMPAAVDAKGNPVKTVSIVERSQEVAAKLEESLKQEGKPFAPRQPIPEPEIQATVAETLTAAKPLEAAKPAAPVTPAATPAAAAPAASKAAPLKGFAKFETAAKEKIRTSTKIEEMIEARDEWVKKSRMTKDLAKKAVYEGLARGASARIQQLARGESAPAAPPVTRIPPAAPAPAPALAAPKTAKVETAPAPAPAPTVTPSAAPTAPAGPMLSLADWVRGKGVTPDSFRSMSREAQKGLLDEYAAYVKEFENRPKGSAAVPETPRAPAPETPASTIGRAEPGGEGIIKMAEEAGAGPPPPGVDPVMWANMYALEIEARATIQKRGAFDPRIVDAMRRFHGSEEAAARLGIKKADVEKISGAPHKRRPFTQVFSEMDQRYRYLMDDPKGFMRTEALIAAAGAGAGALVGGMIEGEDIIDKLAWTLSGALIGGLAAGGGLRAKPGKPAPIGAKVRTGLRYVEELDTANLLAGPAVIKTSLGSMAGVAAGVWQRVREGRYRDAQAILRFMHKEGPQAYWNALTAPVERMGKVGIYTKGIAEKADIQWRPKTRLGKAVHDLPAHVLRPFIASDRAGAAALARGGFSKAESSRLMMIGEPTTWQGQAVLNTINSNMAFRLLAKFPRVRIGALERGVEFTPGLHKINVRHTKGHPRWHLDKQEGLSPKARRARAEFGGGAMVLGTAYGYYMEPDLAHSGLVASAAGPAFAPAAAGIAFGKTLANKDIRSALRDAAISVVSQAPQIGESDIRRLGQRIEPLRPLRRALGVEE